ncbi:MAG: nucleotide exchange factor GrpE [Candidatus Endonucleobacter sp. (ex Gigantidas childressi)]|nr:nucleotide exchange factor GrpE [Candidatus Endonucleobacter sp. (ex Gigantidas childressi)]
MTVENPEAGQESLHIADEVVEANASKQTEEVEQKAEEKEPLKTEPKNTVNLLRELGTLTAAFNEAKDQLLRAQAETQNVKRRSEIDVEKAHKFALEKFVEGLLPVVDSLEKGIESAAQSDGDHDAMKEGMELTLKLFLDILLRFNVKQVSPEGEPFDPNFHQAMSIVPNSEVEPNTIISVFQKGYTLNERIVRSAMVVISKSV